MVQQKRITNNTIKSECFINQNNNNNNNNNLSSFNIINNLNINNNSNNNINNNNSNNNELLTNLQHKPFQSMEKEFLNKFGVK